MPPATIYLVSGLPRSGTSMMMRMLEAGGLQPFTDRLRQSDPDNPKGYYEFEPVKKLKEDKSWVPRAEGKVLKVISELLADLPPTYRYRTVFMRRQLDEILASQRQMLLRRGKAAPSAEEDRRIAELFTAHLKKTETWLAQEPNFEVLYLSYNQVLQDPDGAVRSLSDFLGAAVDPGPMAEVVDPRLHRQKSP